MTKPPFSVQVLPEVEMSETALELAEKHAHEEILSILRKRGLGVKSFQHEVDKDGFHVYQSIVDPASPVAIEWWYGVEDQLPIYGMDLLVRDAMIVSRDFAGLFRVERMFDHAFHDKSGWHYKIEGTVTPHLELPGLLRSFGSERWILPDRMNGWSDFVGGGMASMLINSSARFFMKHVAR